MASRQIDVQNFPDPVRVTPASNPTPARSEPSTDSKRPKQDDPDAGFSEQTALERRVGRETLAAYTRAKS